MPADYEKWIWTELVGFDNTRSDMGAGSYLDALGFQPRTICLFVSSPDFILQHPKPGGGDVLPIDCCVYAAYTLNEERKRQEWTREQVRTLIGALHARGVAVYVSAMTWYTNNRFHEEWLDTHKEMIAWENIGPQNGNNLSPLKRLKDGSYFEDFFLRQLLDVIHYYGFDGWHAADGWGPAMHPIFVADFSDDMIEQFTRWSGAALPEQFREPCAGPDHDDREACKARADWIWRNKRAEWIEFWTQRWHSFFKKIADALRKEGKSIMVNSAMTRDPFEAMYRFGVDYGRLMDAGVDGFVVETGAAAQDLVSGDRIRHYDYNATMMLMRAYLPTAKLVILHVVQDHCENFDGLRHMPTAIEKEVLSLANLRYYDKDGKLRRTTDGLMVCLGDSLLPEEWKWLHGVWELGFSGSVTKTDGPTVVWSDGALKRQIADFSATRRWPIQRVLFNLLQKGAPVQTVARIDDLDKVDGPLLVINPVTLTDEEIARVFGRKNRPIIVIGGESANLPAPDFHFSDTAQPYPLHCYVYGAGEMPEVEIAAEVQDDLPEDVMGIVETHFFVNELAARGVSDEFLSACAAVISSAASCIRVSEGAEHVKALAMELEDGTCRLLLKSDSHFYCKATVDIGRQVKSARSATSFPFAPIVFDGSELKSILVPNKGAVIVDVKPAEQENDSNE